MCINNVLQEWNIRKYSSTFYIGIDYFGPMGKLKFQFLLSVATQFELYQHQSGEHVESQ